MRTNENCLKGIRRTGKEWLTMWRKGEEWERLGRNEEEWGLRRDKKEKRETGGVRKIRRNGRRCEGEGAEGDSSLLETGVRAPIRWRRLRLCCWWPRFCCCWLRLCCWWLRLCCCWLRPCCCWLRLWCCLLRLCCCWLRPCCCWLRPCCCWLRPCCCQLRPCCCWLRPCCWWWPRLPCCWLRLCCCCCSSSTSGAFSITASTTKLSWILLQNLNSRGKTFQITFE